MKVLSGHTSTIRSVCLNLKESYVAAGAQDGSIKMWDLTQSAKVVRTLITPGSCSPCLSLIFHPTKELLLSYSEDQILTVWDFRNRKILRQMKGTSGSLPALSQNNPESAAQSIPNITPFAMLTEDEKKNIMININTPKIMQFSPNGKWLFYSSFKEDDRNTTTNNNNNSNESNNEITGTHNGAVLVIWDLTKDETFFLDHSDAHHPQIVDEITSIAFHPLELILVTITLSGILRVWSLSSSESEDSNNSLLYMHNTLSSPSSSSPFPKNRTEHQSQGSSATPRVFFNENGSHLFALSHGKFTRYLWNLVEESETSFDTEELPLPQPEDETMHSVDLETSFQSVNEELDEETLQTSTPEILLKDLEIETGWVGWIESIVIIQNSAIIMERRSNSNLLLWFVALDSLSPLSTANIAPISSVDEPKSTSSRNNNNDESLNVHSKENAPNFVPNEAVVEQTPQKKFKLIPSERDLSLEPLSVDSFLLFVIFLIYYLLYLF